MKFLQMPGYFFFLNGEEDKEKQMFHNTTDNLSREKCIANLRLFIVLYCFVLVFFCFLRLVVVLFGL